jgi:hypothetical protein
MTINHHALSDYFLPLRGRWLSVGCGLPVLGYKQANKPWKGYVQLVDPENRIAVLAIDVTGRHTSRSELLQVIRAGRRGEADRLGYLAGSARYPIGQQADDL